MAGGMDRRRAGRFALWLPVFMGAGVLVYFALRVRAAGLGWRRGRTARQYWARCWRGPGRCRVPHAGILAAAAIGFTAAQFATAIGAAARSAAHPCRPCCMAPCAAWRRCQAGGGSRSMPCGSRAPPNRCIGACACGSRPTMRTLVTSGDRISVRALVRPAAPPAYPGAWDMQRDAFFSDLAGSGYALGPVALRDHAPDQPDALDAAAARDDQPADRRGPDAVRRRPSPRRC